MSAPIVWLESIKTNSPIAFHDEIDFCGVLFFLDNVAILWAVIKESRDETHWNFIAKLRCKFRATSEEDLEGRLIEYIFKEEVGDNDLSDRLGNTPKVIGFFQEAVDAVIVPEIAEMLLNSLA